MAAPVASSIHLPDDSGNTGKRIRTQSRLVGADTVHEHMYVPISARKIQGIYLFNSGILTGHTTAHNGTSTGYFWIEMPSGGTKRSRLRRFRVVLHNGASVGADVTTISRYALARFTFTGTASGAMITPAKRIPADDANVSNVRTAATGMTVSVGAVAWAIINPAIEFTTSGIGSAFMEHVWDPNHEDEFIDFGPGEGLLFYGPDTGVSQWRITCNGMWDEYDAS